jgi:hypothetical protein
MARERRRLSEAIEAREADLRRLEGDLSASAEPLERKPAVLMPTWVRQQAG